MMTNYDKLIELIGRAKGDRSLNRFADDSSIDAGHLSRVLRGIMNSPPTPDTLRKIAEQAQNGVTYEDLMLAAGHIDRNSSSRSLIMMRGNMSYDDFSKYLRGKYGLTVSPRLLERYERGIEQPDDTLLEFIATMEDITSESGGSSASQSHTPGSTDDELLTWASDPGNRPYLEFMYRAYKAGITRDMLEKAEISIRL